MESTAVSSNPIHFRTLKKEAKYNQKYQQSLSQWNIPYTALYVPTDFGQTHVISCGRDDGEPLILLHAMGFSSTVWLPNIETLAKDYKVYAIDFIGDLNKSAPSKLPSTRGQCAEWLENVLDFLKIDSCYVGGISYGGFLAINYAIYAPHRVKKLFLLSPAASFVPLHNKFIYKIIAMSAIPLKIHVNHFIKWLSKHKLNKPLVEQFHAAFRHGSLSLKVPPGVYSDDELRALQMPLLLLLGDQEVISDVNAAFQRATGVCKHIQAEIIPGCGHLLNLEKSEYVNIQVDNFLSE